MLHVKGVSGVRRLPHHTNRNLEIKFDWELFFHLGFIYQHHGDIVLDGINSFAFAAFQALIVWSQRYGLFAQWTNQNLQQIPTDRHRAPRPEEHGRMPAGETPALPEVTSR